LLVLLEQSSLNQQQLEHLQWLQQQQSQSHHTQQQQFHNLNTNKKPPANNRGLFALKVC
jgi:hypothetical protein